MCSRGLGGSHLEAKSGSEGGKTVVVFEIEEINCFSDDQRTRHFVGNKSTEGCDEYDRQELK